jgi:glycosyltransferase involved in cell wall biosynthesis
VRVIYVTHTARRSGAELALLRFLAAVGKRVSATVILAEDGDLVQALRDAGAEPVVLPMAEDARALKRAEVGLGRRQATAAAHVARYAVRLASELRARRPDLVHTNSLKAGPYGSVAARLAGVPVVWHLHDHLTREHLPARAVAPMRLLAATLPDALLTVSQSVRRAVGWVRPGLQTDVIPFPVPMPAEPVALRDRVEVIGMVGRLAPWKGQHVFLDAFARAFPEGPVRARVVGGALFGETDYEQRLHAQAAALGIAERVEFTGHREDVDAEFRQLDVFVHASISGDPLAQVVVEGMGTGLPVVAAGAGGIPEYLHDGVGGVLHRPGDADDLARAMRQAAGPLEARRAMASAGRAAARQFTPEVLVGRMLDFYERVRG